MTTTDELLNLMFAPAKPWNPITRQICRDFGADAAASFHSAGVFFVAVMHNGQYVIARVAQRFEHRAGIGKVLAGHDNGEIIRTARTRRAAKALATRMNRANA